VAHKQKTDTHFFNSFSLVLGILVAIAILLFALARYLGAHTQLEQITEEQLKLKETRSNIAPVGHEAVAGQDNSALAALETGPVAPVAEAPKTGKEAFEKICTTCHTPGLAGAPKIGDRAAWAPRIAQGKETLYQHAIAGYTGEAGVMPARGGSGWPDDVIRMAVDHMLDLNK
jgi:cytochrome c5